MQTEDIAAVQSPPATVVMEQRILHILENYPILSPSMLQISLGSGLPTSMWHPVLHSLIEAGKVARWTKSVVSPFGRVSTLTFLSLARNQPSQAQ